MERGQTGMTGTIAAAMISAAAAIAVCIINNWMMDRRRQERASAEFEILKATVTEEIKHLRDAVEKHNQVIERVYNLESRMDVAEERQKVANHRIEDLEKGGANV